MNERTIRVVLASLWTVMAAAAASPSARAQDPAPKEGSSPAGLRLQEALERALALAPEAAIARADADEARANAHLAEAPYRPEAWATSTPGYASGLPVAVAGQVPSIAGVAVRTTLYDPASRAAAHDARAEADARESEIARAQSSIALSVVEAYGRVADDGGLVEGARRELELREAIFRRASALRGEGRATDLEVRRAELEVLRSKQRLLDRTLGKDLDVLQLGRLIDWPRGEALLLADDPLAVVADPPREGNLAVARAADPEARSLDRQRENLAHAVELRGWWFRPSVVAEAQYLRLASYNGFDQYFVKFKPNDFSVALAVSLPIWSGGRADDAAAAARARLVRVDAARRARERDLELEVARAEGELARASAAWGVARSAEAVAAEGVLVARALSAEGRGEPDGLELAEIAAREAHDVFARAGQGYLAARVTLLALRGELPGALSERGDRVSRAGDVRATPDGAAREARPTRP